MKRLLPVLILAAAAGPALADSPVAPRRYVEVQPPDKAVRAGGLTRTIFLNRCVGDCTVTMGSVNDASVHQTSILTGLSPGAHSLTEFSGTDEQWAAVVKCVQEVYSPYGVKIVDTKPTDGVYNETLVAGRPEELGQDMRTLGVAPLATNCSPLSNQMAFAFANAHGATGFVDNLCWTVSQESAHIYGLDHEYQFTDPDAPTPNRPDTGLPSACNDPMTYLTDCGGQKFFRDVSAICGEFDNPRACKCTDTQNSHSKLLQLFGPGSDIAAAPTVTVITPKPNAMVKAGAGCVAQSSAQRGVARVELYLNGALYGETLGAPFGLSGQGSDQTYGINIPSDAPDSIYDVVMRSYDDLGTFTDSAPVTVTKGAPCSGTSCGDHQTCSEGRCTFDPPTAELGDACTFAQECTTQHCESLAGGEACTQDCVVGDPSTCPSGFECLPQHDPDNSAGFCNTADGGGCCSSTHAPGGGTFALAGLVALAIVRRRRPSN